MLEFGLRDEVERDEQLADAAVRLARLMFQHLLQLPLREHALAHQDVAQPLAPVDDARVRAAALVEVDLAEARTIGNGEPAGLQSQGEQLADVGETGLLETALDRHATPSPGSRCPECTASARAASRDSGTS